MSRVEYDLTPFLFKGFKCISYSFHIKPHKYVLSVLQSFTLSIPMQQGKARSHAKEQCKGAKGTGGGIKTFYLP